MSESVDREVIEPRPLQCMEVWGGSDFVERVVTTPGLDAWVFSRPYDGAIDGGDVHYVTLCGRGFITRIVVADISGHGSVVADMSRELRTLVRRYINAKSQTGIVKSLNQSFAEYAKLNRFATAVVASYLANRDRLAVCNAGHPRPLWYRADRSTWSILEGAAGTRDAEGFSNLPLGLDDETPYDLFHVDLSPGDLLLFYTDALIEAASPEGAQLGESGLLAIASAIESRDPSVLGRSLLAAIDRYRGDQPPDDDTTLLVVRHNAGNAPRLSIRQKVDVYAKFFGLKDY